MMYPSAHTETPIFPQFIATCFSEDGVKYALPLIETHNHKGERKYADTKSCLTKEQYKTFHEKKIVKVDGEWYRNQIKWELCSHIELSLRANEDVYCIDIDDPNMRWDDIPSILRDCPYTKSRNKKLPHFIFRLGGVDNEKIKHKFKGGFGSNNCMFGGWKTQEGDSKIDFLASHLWERKDACIYNWDFGMLPFIEWDDIKSWVRPDERNKVNEFGIGKGDIRSYVQPVAESDDEGSTTGESSVDEEPKSKPQPKPKVVKNTLLVAASSPIIDANKDSQKWIDYTNIIITNYKNKKWYGNWYKLQLATFNIGISWDTFNQVMKNGSDYDADKNKATWDNNNANHDKKVGWATIKRMARECDPAKAKELDRKYSSQDLINTPFSSGMIADYFAELYGDKFIYSNEALYCYNGIYWEKGDKKNSRLVQFVDIDYFRELTEYVNKKKYYYNKMKEEEKDNADTWNKRYDAAMTFEKNIQQLRSAKQREYVVKDILMKITNNDIEFDKSPYLFAFENKIYDLEKGEFKNPDAEDYISITTGYDFDENYDIGRVETLNRLFVDIFPDVEVRNYYLNILSTGLCGVQIEHLFVASGVGGNGKSVSNSLMLKMLGGYGYKLPSSILLQELKTGANPEVANLDKKRFVLTQEPNSRRRICASTVKELTGDKTLNSRGLYSSKCEISLNLTLVMECNDNPPLDEVGDGMARRLRKIPFDSRCVSQETFDKLDDKTNIFVADPYFKSDEFQETHRQALFMIMKEQYAIFKANKNVINKQPDICRKVTDDYLACNDDIFGWFSSKFEKTGGMEILYVCDVFDKFKTSEFYYTLSKNDQRKYNKKGFEEKVQKNLFLRSDFKARDAYIGKVQLKKTALVGWVKKNETEVVEDEEFVDE